MEEIKLENAGKKIKDRWIFKDVSATFSKGNIYGLIGKNGSGKTMLLRSICGLTPITSGIITVEGKRVGVDIDIPDSVGVIIEVPGFLYSESGFKNLKYLAGIRQIIDDQEVKKTMEKVGVDPESKKRVGKYSLGMRQRLGIAQAIMENPNILLLDEPMNGLDTDGVAIVKNILKDMRDRGKTIVLASHYMEDIAELCDSVYLMENGSMSKNS